MSLSASVLRTLNRVVRVRLVMALAASLAGAVTLFTLQACGSRSPIAPSGDDCSGAQRSTLPCDAQLYMPQFSPLPCPSRAEVEQVRREIPITIKSDPSAGILECRQRDGSLDLSPVQFRVYRALLFLRQMQFDTPLPWTDKTVWGWLLATIPKGIEIDSIGESHSCVNCPGPITLAYHAQSAAEWTALDRSITGLPWDTIVEETRHAEGYIHTCRLGASGIHTHDRTIAEMGASGVVNYLLLWLGAHSNEDPLFRLWAQSRADMQRIGSLFCCECGGIPAGAATPPPGS